MTGSKYFKKIIEVRKHKGTTLGDVPSNDFLTYLYHKNPMHFMDNIVPWLKRHRIRFRIVGGMVKRL